MDRRDFLKILTAAGAGAILAPELLAAVAERPFDQPYGDCSGGAHFGNVFTVTDQPDQELITVLSDFLRRDVEKIEAEGLAVRGWEWKTTPLGSCGTIDPLNQVAHIGYMIWV